MKIELLSLFIILLVLALFIYIFSFFFSITGLFGSAEKSGDTAERQVDVKKEDSTQKNFLSEYDLSSGEYHLLINEKEKHYYVPPDILNQYASSITAHGFNWNVFVPGVGFRGPYLRLYKGNELVKEEYKYNVKEFDYSAILPHAIELTLVSDSYLRIEAEQTIQDAQARLGKDVFALSYAELPSPDQTKYKFDYINDEIYLPTYWLASDADSEQVGNQIEREIKYLVKAYPNIELKIEVYKNGPKFGSHHSRDGALIKNKFDEDGNQLAVTEVSYYNTEVTLYCLNENDCNAAAKILSGETPKTILNNRNAELLDNLPDKYFDIYGEDRIMAVDFDFYDKTFNPFNTREISYSVFYFKINQINL